MECHGQGRCCRHFTAAQSAQQSSTHQVSQLAHLQHATSLPRGIRNSPAGQAMRHGVTPHRYLVVAKRALSGPASNKYCQELQGYIVWLWHLWRWHMNRVHGANKINKTHCLHQN